MRMQNPSPSSARLPGETLLPERLLTALIVVVLVSVSTIVMLKCASPELCWDEADYAASIHNSYRVLWSHADYIRHGHGPVLIYLAKLGQDLLPAAFGSLETRLRFFDALVASFAVGLIYGSLRHIFQTSRAAALVGASLLLFSGSRVVENNIIGPHGLMVACTVALVALGYQWRDKPSLVAALGLAAVLAYGALTMTYVIPAAVGWAFAVCVAGRGWFGIERNYFKISWFVPVMAAVAGLIFVILWPAGANPRVYPKDFLAYVFFPNHCALVGNTFYEVVPRWAALFWMANLDPVLSLVSIVILAVFCWRAFHGLELTSKHAYLGACVFYFLVTSLTAHLAGPRNILQFLGVLSLATGAIFDEALGNKPRLSSICSFAVVVLAGLSLLWVVRFSSYTPFLATDGYQAFLKQNQARLSDKVGAIVSGVPILHFYSAKTGVPVAWDVHEMPCISIHTEVPLPPEIKYVLLPSYIYEGMPPEETIRRVVVPNWKVVWSYKTDHVWRLTLFERPDEASR
jgi:hypothetical protein